MAKLKDILNGWGAYLINDATSTEIAKQRAEVCSNCNKPVKGSFEVFMPDYSIKEIQGLKCSICDCPLSTATRSKNYKCPLGKW
jgi:hypothetical protein